jgi:glycosyltransferase involved in cell wall biosynthesis
VAERTLHIGIDAREMSGQPTGVGRYLSSVLDVWMADPSMRHRISLFAPADLAPSRPVADGRVRTIVLPATRAGTWWEQVTLPRAVKRARVDVLLSPGYTRPLRLGCASVVVIHDLSFFAHPEWFRPRERLRRQWITRAGARRAQSVVTISEFSAGEIVRWLGIPRARITLALPGAPRVARGMPTRPPVVLFVGSIFTRRRIPDLLRAFAIVQRTLQDARLVLVGDNRTYPFVDIGSLIAQLDLSDVVEWRRYASEAELETWYDRARVFAFLSDYEGFAMTPLEAIAHGVTPVLLETPVAREIYDDAARLVPRDEHAIAAALMALLTHDDDWRALGVRGRSRLGRFSWTTTAAALLGAIGHAASARR